MLTRIKSPREAHPGLDSEAAVAVEMEGIRPYADHAWRSLVVETMIFYY